MAILFCLRFCEDLPAPKYALPMGVRMTFFVTTGLGIIMLIAGRKLFWLFVGVVGFTIGINMAERFFPGESETTLLVLALITGVLFAVLVLFLKRIAVGVAGFVAGGFMATYIVSLLNLGIDLPTWILVLIGGVIGAVLVAVLFDWALILMSSLIGANLIVQAIDQGDKVATIIFVGLFLVGVMIQAKTKRG
jgi:hypothetical protein